MEEHYDSNLHNLEEALSAMSKELTTLKYARENVASANSRLRLSRQSETTD
jgi:regulator of replication initiation timing